MFNIHIQNLNIMKCGILNIDIYYNICSYVGVCSLYINI